MKRLHFKTILLIITNNWKYEKLYIQQNSEKKRGWASYKLRSIMQIWLWKRADEEIDLAVRSHPDWALLDSMLWNYYNRTHFEKKNWFFAIFSRMSLYFMKKIEIEGKICRIKQWTQCSVVTSGSCFTFRSSVHSHCSAQLRTWLRDYN